MLLLNYKSLEIKSRALFFLNFWLIFFLNYFVKDNFIKRLLLFFTFLLIKFIILYKYIKFI